MLVWFTKSSITQFHASALFLFQRSYIKRAISTKKNLTKIFRITNLLFLRKMVTDKVGLLSENDPYAISIYI